MKRKSERLHAGRNVEFEIVVIDCDVTRASEIIVRNARKINTPSEGETQTR